MDFNHEEEAIAGLELDRVKIKAVAELCSSTQSELNVAKLIERYFAKEEHPANKTALFLLASQLLLLAKANQNTQYLKHLSPKIGLILSQLNKIIIDQSELVDLVAMTLKKWQSEKIFAESFINRLKVTAKDILQKHQEEEVVWLVIDQPQPQPKSKYSKQFLQNMKEICRYDLTSSLYDNHSKQAKLQTQVSQLKKDFEELNTRKNEGKAEKKHAQELLKQVEECCKRLEELACNIHKGLKTIADQCEPFFSEVIAQER